MASSFPFSLDLNLAPPIQTWGQGAAPVWMSYFGSSRGPVTVNDSLLLYNEVAIGVARSVVTLRDVGMLGTRDDNWLVSDAMTLSVQSAASIRSVGHRLIEKSHEVQVLRAQLTAERDLVDEYQRDIKRLKKDRAKKAEEYRHQLQILQEENEKLSKMVSVYSKDMQKQLEALENPGKRKRDHERSSREKVVILLGNSSDEPQEAMHEDPREDIERAKLKSPTVKK
ncbi:hypothetical protein L3X38_025126 [Prunus dulcis]|uniref:Uncharacterized protein n=1 Tax=Prunus dulcis TaxID=3755 RepID=A0AAD4W2A1_PRUDU|nr:hypothetical protein L3X38_025126 [Prunus dulcis]